MSIDHRTAHLIDARTMLGLLPGIGQTELHEVRVEFARYLTTRAAAGHTTWQEAWNSFTGAGARCPGEVRYTPIRCAECRGRGFNPRTPGRNLVRTGRPDMCWSCRGTRRGQFTRRTALAASVPNDTEQGGGA